MRTTPTCFLPSSLPRFLPSLLTPRLPARSRGAEEALELQSGFKEGAAFYTSVVTKISAVAEQMSVLCASVKRWSIDDALATKSGGKG